MKMFVHNVQLFALSCSCRTLRDDRELHIHPNSVLYGEKPPKWSVVFFKFILVFVYFAISYSQRCSVSAAEFPGEHPENH